MKMVLSYLMIGFGVYTLLLGGQALKGEDGKQEESRMFSALAFSSSVWSFFFGILLIQTVPRMAYFCRCAGMVGTFGYLIAAVYLITHWGNPQKEVRMGMRLFSLMAVLLYPFLMNYDNVQYEMAFYGMSYTFAQNIWNSLYNIYCVVIAVIMLYMGIIMARKARRKRTQVLGKHMLICLGVIFAGMLLDTVFPMFGMGAFPGSSLTQSLGVIIAHRALLFSRKNKVTVTNMSDFIYSSVETPVLIYDEKGRLEQANRSAAEFFSLTEGEYENIGLHQLFELEEDILQQKSGEETFKIDTNCLVRKAYCRVGINTIYDNYKDIIGYIITVDDLTDKMIIIDQLEEAGKQAEMANRAKSVFLAKMSHEIRTPINAILGMDEMILRESQEKEISEYAISIRQAGKTLLSIINDILDLSKIESGNFNIVPEKYSVPDMLVDLIDILSIKIDEKGLKWKLELSETLPSVLFGDELRIKQIITNIMNNAIKYTEKGQIVLLMDWRKVEDNQCELIIEVTDTGIGIKKEDMGKLFAYYQRVDEVKNHFVEGTGLGLTITKNLAEMMGGNISVNSIYGKGSSFLIHIRQHIIDETPMGKIEDVRRRRIEKPEKEELFIAPEAMVLVVDDNRTNLVIMKELLKRTKINVDLLTSGELCVDMVRHEKYHMVFLDHMMPGMDGIETLHHMKKLPDNQSKDAVVVALTANAIMGAREMYLENGFHDYLSKPIESKELEAMLRKYLPAELIIVQN